MLSADRGRAERNSESESSMRHNYLPVCLLVLACGADQTDMQEHGSHPGHEYCGVDSEPIDAPEFAGFSSDAEHDDYCLDNPDSVVCGADLGNDLGQTRQAWTQHEYHGSGQNDGHACYSALGLNQPCVFPRYKQHQVVANRASCNVWTGTVVNGRTITVADLDTMMAATVAGYLRWHGAGTNVVVSTNAVPGNHYTGTVRCMTPGEHSFLAQAHQTGGFFQAGNNLPVGPHGVDEGAVYTFSAGEISFSPPALTGECNPGCGGTQLIGKGGDMGQHEAGHLFGFSHFSTGFMKPTYTPGSITQGFKDALTAFNGATSGYSIIDGTLDSLPGGGGPL